MTISRPEVIALIEEAAKNLIRDQQDRGGCLSHAASLGPGCVGVPLFEAHRGPVRVRQGVDLIAPTPGVEPDAETGREIEP